MTEIESRKGVGAAGSGAGLAEEGEATGAGLIRVAFPAFTGPLDLLLHLIQREEIEITDIPIAKITREYLDTLELMRELDLEVAGEFL
ncbi:MAG TPA: segregation/condensation protein A, partial [Methylomirabilota bacterium]|nr:segregation/condensation protein A [Methylomirabilota bacterium]